MNIYLLQQMETPRLIIRPVQIGDGIELNAAINRSLESLQRWMPWAKDPSLDITLEHIQRGVYYWQSQSGNDFPMVVVHKQDQKIIGGSGFNEQSVPIKLFFEIGYWVDSKYQGLGLVTEFVNALTRYALDTIHANRVQISTQANNKRSIAVAKRCGFEFEARYKNYRIDCMSGLPVDGLIFSCTNIGLLPLLKVTWRHYDDHYIDRN